jgi:hypothetical protein
MQSIKLFAAAVGVFKNTFLDVFSISCKKKRIKQTLKSDNRKK